LVVAYFLGHPVDVVNGGEGVKNKKVPPI